MEARYHLNEAAKQLVHGLTEGNMATSDLPEYRHGDDVIYRTRELARRESTEPFVEEEVIVCLVDAKTNEDVGETVWTDEQCHAHREMLKDQERMAMMPVVFPEFMESSDDTSAL